jgi:hypothetical protein
VRREAAAPPQDCAISQQQIQGKPGVVCRLFGAYDTDGRDGTIYFTASRIYHPEQLGGFMLPLPLPRFFAPKLRDDLQIEGAECEGPTWRRGMRVKGSHTLRCRRLGTAAVELRLTTSKGDCVESLPELREPPWTTQCTGAPASRPVSVLHGASCGEVLPPPRP